MERQAATGIGRQHAWLASAESLRKALQPEKKQTGLTRSLNEWEQEKARSIGEEDLPPGTLLHGQELANALDALRSLRAAPVEALRLAVADCHATLCDAVARLVKLADGIVGIREGLIEPSDTPPRGAHDNSGLLIPGDAVTLVNVCLGARRARRALFLHGQGSCLVVVEETLAAVSASPEGSHE